MLRKLSLIVLVGMIASNFSAQATPIVSSPASLPDNFGGEIIYTGHAEAIITSPENISQTAISDNESKDTIYGPNISRSKGNYYIKVNYSGQKIKGQYFILEEPDVKTRFRGVKYGDKCSLRDNNNNYFIAKCTSSEFISELVYWDDQGKMYEFYAQASSTPANDIP